MAQDSSQTVYKVQSIDTDVFDSAIEAFRKAIEIYGAARVRIFNSSELLLSKWEGEGKAAFQREYDLLKTRLSDEEENLKAIKQNLEDSKQTYIDWDAGVAPQLKSPMESPASAPAPGTTSGFGGSSGNGGGGGGGGNW